jgi:hypothetical protein
MWKFSGCIEINVLVGKHLHGTQLTVNIDKAFLGEKVLMTIGDGRMGRFLSFKFAVFKYRKLLVNFNGGLKNGRWTETTQSLCLNTCEY